MASPWITVYGSGDIDAEDSKGAKYQVASARNSITVKLRYRSNIKMGRKGQIPSVG
jgi:hypothetical protein